jgi:MFS family permease
MIPNIYAFSIFRFVSGIVVGVNSTLVPIYVKEMSPISVSGLTGSMTQVFINVGLISSQLMGLGFMDNSVSPSDFYWRIVIILPALPSLLRILLFLTIFNYDTPYYYIQHNRVSEA